MQDYAHLFELAYVHQYHIPQIKFLLSKMARNKAEYLKVEVATRVPWFCVAILHSLESALSFQCHLHNGDPLTARTTHVPVGKPLAPPISGMMPYQWYESAIDALNARGRPPRWRVEDCLSFFEQYNGMGYARRNLNSPYLWSYTNLYTIGKFTLDGHFDAGSISQEIGAAAILKIMMQERLIAHILG